MLLNLGHWLSRLGVVIEVLEVSGTSEFRYPRGWDVLDLYTFPVHSSEPLVLLHFFCSVLKKNV